MILEQYLMEVPLADGWTLEEVALGGPHVVGGWRVVMAHRDGFYQVVEVRKGLEGDEFAEVHHYVGRDPELATAQYLKASRQMTEEARGLAPTTG